MFGIVVVSENVETQEKLVGIYWEGKCEFRLFATRDDAQRCADKANRYDYERFGKTTFRVVALPVC